MTSVPAALLAALLGAHTSGETSEGRATAPAAPPTSVRQPAVAGPGMVVPDAPLVPAPLDAGKALELVVVGPENERGAMEALLRTLLGARRDITWLMRTTATTEEMLASPPDGHGRFWVDLAEAGHIRLVLPAPDSPATSVVRDVDMGPESARGAASEPRAVASEKAAQIVVAAVHAYSAGGATLAVTPTPATMPAPTQAATAPVPVAVAKAKAPAPHPRSARNPEDDDLPAWHSLAAVAGTHTSPLNVSEPYGQANWLGPSFALAYRYTKPQRYLGVSLSADFSERSIDAIDLTSQFWTLALQGGRSFEWRDIWFFLGVSAGVLELRQRTTATGSSSYLYSLPNQLGVTWSTGGVFAVGGHVQVPFGETLLLDVGVTVPFIVLPRVQKDYDSGTYSALSLYVQGLAGVVVRL